MDPDPNLGELEEMTQDEQLYCDKDLIPLCDRGGFTITVVDEDEDEL